MPFRKPATEAASRTDTLRSLVALDTRDDTALQALLNLATRTLSCALASVCLVDGDQHWPKASSGRDSQPAMASEELMHRIASSSELLEINDVDHDLLTGEATPAGMHHFVGIPLRVDGHRIGVLCLFGASAHTLSATERSVVSDLAISVEQRLIGLRDRLRLRSRELELRTLAEQMPGIVYRAALDASSSTLYVSPMVRELGYSPEAWLTRPEVRLQAIHPDDRERVLKDLAERTKSWQGFELQYRIRHADGRWRHVHDTVRLVQAIGPDGVPGEAVLQGVITDVTDQLLVSRARDQLFTHLPEGVLILDDKDRVLDLNPQAERLLGHPRADLLLNRIDQLLPMANTIRQSNSTDSDEWVLERHYRHPDGHLCTFEDTLRRLDDGTQLRLLRDITQRHEDADWLRKLSMATEQASEAIVITDTAANIEYVNRAMTRTSGYTREELIGQNSRMLQSGLTPPTRHRKLWDALTAGRTWRGFFTNQRKDGTHYIEFAVITPVRGPDGRITNYIAVKEDITEKRQMSADLKRHQQHLDELVVQRTAELEQAREAAVAANVAKSAFLATMSHEIRTPMNGVMGVADVLLQSSLTPHQQELVETINESASALLAIIDDILDFSKIEAGRLVLERRPFDACDLVERACAPLSAMAAGRGVRMNAFCDPLVPRRFVGDEARVRQIVLNLAGNAIKFSAGLDRPGRVSVRVKAGEPGLRLTVIDNGIGMTEEVQRQVFQPFVQGEPSITRNYGGTGLGLAITHRLVDAMNGRIQVSSRPEGGTTFTVDLPLEAGDNGLPATGSELAGIHCQIDLADEEVRADWVAYLSAAGARVSLFDGDPALPAMQENELLVRIGQSSTDGTAPGAPGPSPTQAGAVLVSEEPRGTPTWLAPGCVKLPVVGLRREDLLVAVAMAAGRAFVPAPSERKHNTSTDATGLAAACRGGAVLVAEDNEINRRVISYQLGQLGVPSVLAVDGQEALELWRRSPERYCLMLTDLQMPRLGGIELTGRIRAEAPDGQHMPIIALTANALRSEAQHCLAAGMDDHLTKPVSLSQLESTLQRWLEMAHAPAPPSPVRPQAPNPAQTAGDFDDLALQRVLGTDAEILRDMQGRYLSSLDRTLIEIRETAERGDGAAAAFAAHRLKSSSRLVGAVGMARLLE